MDPKLKAAMLRIRELEAKTEDQQDELDLLHDEYTEKDIIIASLKGQLQNLMLDRTYTVG